MNQKQTFLILIVIEFSIFKNLEIEPEYFIQKFHVSFSLYV